MNDTTNNECETTGKMQMQNEQKTSTDTTPKKIVGIYGLQNKLKPDKWNIGQSWDIISRWNNDYKNIKCKSQPKIYNALIKYGYDGFDKIILEEIKNPTQELINERETYWIKFHNSIENGYNLREGGSRGKHSDESKKKMSEQRAGKIRGPMSDETKRKISLAKQNMSPETRLKMSLAKLGKKIPDEQRIKMNESRVGLKRSQKAIAKTAEKNRGRKNSPEACINISLSLKGKKRPNRTEEHSRNISIALRKRYIEKLNIGGRATQSPSFHPLE